MSRLRRRVEDLERQAPQTENELRIVAYVHPDGREFVGFAFARGWSLHARQGESLHRFEKRADRAYERALREAEQCG
mgnify:CR=1 FL=1